MLTDIETMQVIAAIIKLIQFIPCRYIDYSNVVTGALGIIAIRKQKQNHSFFVGEY